MQTFLPYDDFVLSLDCLDYRRLGKQRVESMQLLNAMITTAGWYIILLLKCGVDMKKHLQNI